MTLAWANMPLKVSKINVGVLFTSCTTGWLALGIIVEEHRRQTSPMDLTALPAWARLDFLGSSFLNSKLYRQGQHHMPLACGITLVWANVRLRIRNEESNTIFCLNSHVNPFADCGHLTFCHYPYTKHMCLERMRMHVCNA